MCEDPRDVTAALHEDQADMLREGGSFDLTLAFGKALSIFGENHPASSRFFVQKDSSGNPQSEHPQSEKE